MSIFEVNITIPPYSPKMNKKYLALNLEEYQAPFLEKTIFSINIFTSTEDYKVYFGELKKFLALNYLYSNQACSMVNKKIDALWHQFILFTREYADFCEHYFGRFIHHSPNLVMFHDDPDLEVGKIGAENFFQFYFMTFGPPHELWFLDD